MAFGARAYMIGRISRTSNSCLILNFIMYRVRNQIFEFDLFILKERVKRFVLLLKFIGFDASLIATRPVASAIAKVLKNQVRVGNALE